MKTKKIKDYIDHSLGFPVHLGAVTLESFRNTWVARINYPRMMDRVLRVLCHLHRPLTGAEVRFVRLHFGLTQSAFAARFGISHVAVHKWEQRGQKATSMQWPTEKDLRLFIQSRLSEDLGAVGKLYQELTARRLNNGRVQTARPEMVEV